MALPAIPIISGLFKLAESWLDGYRKKTEAKDERKAELLRQQGTWDEIQAQNSATSWKDEWLTILFSIPLILAFVPPAVPVVYDGFAALEKMPDWYVTTLGVIVAASFGVRSAISVYTGFGKAKTANIIAKAKELKEIEQVNAELEEASDKAHDTISKQIGK